MSDLSSRPYRRLRARVLRDASVCGICGGLLDKTLQSPHPDSVVVDHILPRKHHPDLALDPKNLSPCHRRCNRDKSDKLDYQPQPAPSRDW